MNNQNPPNTYPSLSDGIALLPIFAFLAFLGCSGMLPDKSTIPIVEQIPVPEPQPLPPNVLARPLILDRVIFDIPRGTVIGETRKGRLCISPQPLKWDYEIQVLREGEFHREFENIVSQYGYRLPDKPKSLFDEIKPSGAELIIAAKITNLRENNCFALGGLNLDQNVYLGNVRLPVHWEVYSLSQKRVVLVLDNEGSATGDEFKPAWEHHYRARAFGNAFRGLLKNSDFLKLVTSAPETS